MDAIRAGHRPWRWRGTISVVCLSLVTVSCLRGGFSRENQSDSGGPGSGRGCDKEHPCAEGWSCIDGWCRLGGDGGSSVGGKDGAPWGSAWVVSDGSSPLTDAAALPPMAPGLWVLIPAGSFSMGSPDAEVGRVEDEVVHRVTLTRDFWMMTREITQGQFRAVMGYNPSTFGPLGSDVDCGAGCPVEQVNWHEVAAYANELSGAEDLAPCYSCRGSAPDCDCEPSSAYGSPYDCPGYRLPTEAEWEYAARAGDGRATHNGDLTVTECVSSAALDPISWHCGNSLGRTHPGQLKRPNAWGLYDMLGNVYEWCHDWYAAYPVGPATNPAGPASGEERVDRGGSWLGHARWARAAHRDQGAPGIRGGGLGGRLVRSRNQ